MAVRRVAFSSNFAARVAKWANDVNAAVEFIVKESAKELARQMQQIVPVDTGFLRQSLRASNSEMPRLSLSNPHPPGRLVYDLDLSPVELVIENTSLGDTIYLGYTAKYGGYVHYGANGRAPRPWVNMVVQRWQVIVRDKVKLAKAVYKL